MASLLTAIPSIACLGVIGRHNNPLHISVFPSYDPNTNTFTPIRTPLQFQLVLSSTIDVFELRAQHNAAGGTGLSGDLGLLHAVDDRLAAYGFETNTGIRFVVIVDMRGRLVDRSVITSLTEKDRASGVSSAVRSAGQQSDGAVPPSLGLRDGELRPVFKAMLNAYIQLLQNPFYNPDEQVPSKGRPWNPSSHQASAYRLGTRVGLSKRFTEDMKRIGESWTPGVTAI